MKYFAVRERSTTRIPRRSATMNSLLTHARKLLSITCSILLLACASEENAVDKAGSGAIDSISSGTAVVAVLGDFESFNPVTSTHFTSDHIGKFMLFTPLITYDNNLQPAPALAERWELTDTSVTLLLRSDVKWHDGQPVTAKDVKFTFDIAKQPKSASLLASAFLNQVRSAVVRDPRTIHFTFEAPHAQALDGFFWAPIPQHLLGNVGAGELAQSSYNQQPVGNGPFRFGSWQKGQRLTLVANPNYPQALGGPPELEQVVFRVLSEPTTMTTELLNGSADVIGYTLLPEQAQQIQGERGARLEHVPSREFTFVAWNNTREPFTDARVRRALAMATNRGQMIQALLQGYGQAAHGMIPPWSPMYTATEGVPHNLPAARQLLAEAGWRDTNADGILDKRGKPLRFTLMTNSENRLRQDVVTMIQHQLQQIGAQADIRTAEFHTMLDQYKRREYDAVVSAWSLDAFRIDPTPLFSCAEARKQRSANRTGYCNPQADRLMQQALRTTDPAQAKQIWARFTELLQQDQPLTFLFWLEDLYGVGPRLENVEIDARGMLGNVARWRVRTGHER